MKVLLLAASGSTGFALDDPSTAWGNQLPAAIERLTGEQPEIVLVGFVPWRPDAMEYLERQLEQGPFDVVVLSQLKYGFTVWTVHNRVREMLGNRVGKGFLQGVIVFNRGTRKRGDEGLRRKLNRMVHRSARKVIGDSPALSVQALTEIYLRVLARLARVEDTQVVVLAASHVSGVLTKRHPQVVEQTAYFREAIRLEAERRRFDWIDRVALMRAAVGETDRFFVDGVHETGEVHGLLAAAIAESIAARAGVRPVAAAAITR